MGKVAMTKAPSVTNQQINAIKVNSNYDPSYIYYCLKNNYKLIRNAAGGSTALPLLNKTDFERLGCNAHVDKIEQKKISLVLSSIDEKIAINNRINTELEAMAKTLYDYWFVQFDFPDTNGKPYKTSGGKMVYNATLKRDIPVGWNLKPILECCDVIDCLHSKKPESNYFSNEHYLLQLENIEDNGLLDMSMKYFVSHEDYINWTSRIEVKQHDIVITNAGRIAAFAQIPEGIKCGIGRNITAIRPKNIKKNYFFSALSGIDIQSQIAKNLDHGAFFKSFNVKGIKLLKIIKTDNGLEDKFESLITPVIEKRQKVQHENQMLKELRDWLLPLLMNGQVTVK